MENYVYNIIDVRTTDPEKIKLLKKISEIGLCRYYKPIPEELNISHPQNTDALKYKAIHNLKTYGYPDWYEFVREEWGTKWGDVEVSLDGTTLHFRTVYTPVASEVIDMFRKDFPDFQYSWEEERGAGEIWNSEDGDMTLVVEYGIPKWSDTVEIEGYRVLALLAEPYLNGSDKYEAGWYYEFNLEEFVSEEIEEAKRLAMEEIQLSLRNKILTVGINIVSCGGCGRVLLHEVDEGVVSCPDCKLEIDIHNCPDLI